ncbi:HNH endonuclease [Nocardioides sp.]|uniref:HNH endonuclease n=1 Tax=Nocardioides sp. TaxID=35761 RepID=UPI0025FB0248|nr:HNH endonuclease [Nocardioides sp.]
MKDLGQHGRAGSAGGAVAALPSAAEIHAFAARVSSGSDAGLTDAERIDFLRAAEQLKCVLEGAQADVSVAFDASQRAEQARSGVRAERQGRGVAAQVAQVALARRVSHHRGVRLLHLAKRLEDLPETRSALRTGRITEFKASIIARDTECLSPRLREKVDLAIAGDPEWLESLGERQLDAEVQKLAYRCDPRAFVNRSAQAVSDRRVTSRPAPDTMMRLGALLPVVQGVAAYAALSSWASTQIAAGDPRSKGQLMADRLVELVTGQASADQVPVRADVMLADTTLIGMDEEPGWVAGYGPVPAEIARHLIRHAHEQGLAALRRLYAHPDTGRLAAAESRSTRFPDGLADLIGLRDQGRCRSPWCDAPIADTDHAQPLVEGGATTFLNGQGCCEACNIAKEAVGWRARPRPGPDGHPDLHTIETTTPTGHVHTSVAPQVRVVRRPLPLEIYLGAESVA